VGDRSATCGNHPEICDLPGFAQFLGQRAAALTRVLSDQFPDIEDIFHTSQPVIGPICCSRATCYAKSDLIDVSLSKSTPSFEWSWGCICRTTSMTRPATNPFVFSAILKAK